MHTKIIIEDMYFSSKIYTNDYQKILAKNK